MGTATYCAVLYILARNVEKSKKGARMARLRTDNRTKECQEFSRWVRGRLAERQERQEDLAAVLGTSRQSLSAKINNRAEFTLMDIVTICEHFGQSFTVMGNDR